MKSDSFMRIPSSFKSEVIYARDIVKAGLDVAVPLAPAALGAAVGILGVYLGRKGRNGNTAVFGGLVGCALGFSSGVAWGTREEARQRYLDAAHHVQAVRDAHWLEKHPIAYA